MVVGSLVTYATVKAYSLKGKLLSKKIFQTLAESRNLDEFASRLNSTSYSDYIRKIPKPYTSNNIEISFRGKQAELYYMMMSSVGGSNLLMAYYYKFIFKNLKNILKGKILGKTQSQIESTIGLRAEELIQRRDVTLKALTSKNIEEVISNFKSYNFGNDVEKAIMLYNDIGEIGVIDTYLDKILYQNLADSIKSKADLNLLKLFGTELDLYNITNIVRGKFWNLDEQSINDLLVSHTSSTSDELLSKMISAENLKSSFMELTKTKFSDIIPSEADDIVMINEFERKFDLFLYNSLLKEFANMFKLSTVVSVVRLYDYEIKKKEKDNQNTENSKSEIGWGHQIRSYVLQPYRLVKDNRTNFESTSPDKILDGNLDEFLKQFLY